MWSCIVYITSCASCVYLGFEMAKTWDPAWRMLPGTLSGTKGFKNGNPFSQH
jgi:hypothetical protein